MQIKKEGEYMKKLHSAIKAVVFTAILVSFPSSDSAAMETLPDSGMGKLLKDAGDRLAKKRHRNTSYASNQTNAKETSSRSQNSEKSEECSDKKRQKIDQ
jgi:hypothetical protein